MEKEKRKKKNARTEKGKKLEKGKDVSGNWSGKFNFSLLDTAYVWKPAKEKREEMCLRFFK